LLVETASPLGFLITRPRAHFIARALGEATIRPATLVAILIVSIPIVIPISHESSLNNSKVHASSHAVILKRKERTQHGARTARVRNALAPWELNAGIIAIRETPRRYCRVS
jgi:hypothetical protein